MDLRKLLEMQKELDDVILDKVKERYRCYLMDHEDLLTERLLALQVEVSELSNKTRCFKYWSIKPSESKEDVMEELIDVLFFWLSIAHTLEYTAEELEEMYKKKYRINLERQKNGY